MTWSWIASYLHLGLAGYAANCLQLREEGNNMRMCGTDPFTMLAPDG